MNPITLDTDLPLGAVFVGSPAGWKRSEEPQCQTLFIRPEAQLRDVLDFVGVPLMMLGQFERQQRPVTVCCRLMPSSESVALNVLGGWLLDSNPGIVGALVILDGVRLS